MANVISTEVVEFKADGADEVLAKMRQVQSETDGMAQKMKAASEASRKQFDEMKAASGQNLPPLRNMPAASGALPKYTSQAKQMSAEMNRGIDGYMRKMQRTMADGLAKTKEMSALLMKIPVAVNGARSALGSVPGVGGMLAGGSVAATWAKGFAGTVEAGRMDREVELLGREVAGAFKPVTDAFTEAIRSLRMGLEHLNPNQQNAMVAAGVTAAGAAATSKATGTSFGAAIPMVASTAWFMDKLQILKNGLYDTARQRMDIRNGNYTMTQDEFAGTGLQSIANEKDPERRQKAIAEAEAKLAKAKELERQNLKQNGIGMLGETLGGAFGFYPFGSTGNNFRSFNENAAKINDYEKGLGLIKSGRTDGITSPNESRRKVTPDNISHGELGSSYEEATLGLMKVNMGGDQQSNIDTLILKLTELVTELKEKRDDKGGLVEHWVNRLTQK